MSEQKPQLIYARIAACLSEVEAVGKSHKNQQQGYSFRSIDDFYDAIQPVLARNKVFIAPTILEHKREERTTKSGAFMMTTVTHVRFKVFTEDGSYIEADALGEGADSGDKSANKAAASAMKYLFMQVFSVRVNGENYDTENESPQYQPRRAQAQNRAPEPSNEPKPRQQATTEQIVPKSPKVATEATRKWLLDNISPLPNAIDYAAARGFASLEEWPLDQVPTSKQGLEAIIREINAFKPGPKPTEEMPPDEIGNVVIHIPPAGVRLKDYTERDTIGSLYRKTKEGDGQARTRLWGFVGNFEANGYNGQPPTKDDLALRAGLDAFEKWYEQKKMREQSAK